VTRHTPTDEMPRYKAVVRFQVRPVAALELRALHRGRAAHLSRRAISRPYSDCRVVGACTVVVRHMTLICSLPLQTHEEACRAVREKYGGYICQLPITLRVLP